MNELKIAVMQYVDTFGVPINEAIDMVIEDLDELRNDEEFFAEIKAD